MIKKFALASAIAMAAVGLTAGPATAVPDNAGTLTMWEGEKFQGEFVVLSEGAVVVGANTCTQTPLNVNALTTKSAVLEVTGTQRIAQVQFFSDTACAAGSRVATLTAGTPTAIAATFDETGTAGQNGLRYRAIPV